MNETFSTLLKLAKSSPPPFFQLTNLASYSIEKSVIISPYPLLILTFLFTDSFSSSSKHSDLLSYNPQPFSLSQNF